MGLLRRLRRLRALILALPLIVGGVGVGLGVWADAVTRRGLAWIGREVLDVDLHIADVDLALADGGVRIDDLILGNPPGFRSKHLLHLREARVSVDLGSLRGESLHLSRLYLDGVTLTIEQQRGVTNLQHLLERIPLPEDPNYPSSRPLRIDDLQVRHIVVRTKLTPLPGEADVLEIPLPDLHLDRLGYEAAMDIPTLLRHVLGSLTATAFQPAKPSADPNGWRRWLPAF